MKRNERGIVRSDMTHIAMWVASGESDEVPEIVVGGLRLREAAVRFLLRRMDEVS